jgi:hypothetical protein
MHVMNGSMLLRYILRVKLKEVVINRPAQTCVGCIVFPIRNI